MATIKITLADDAGREINTQTYELGSNLHRLSEMEVQIESLRPQFLCDLTNDLLISSQLLDKKKGYEGIKKSNLILR